MKSKGLLLVNFASGMSPDRQDQLGAHLDDAYGQQWNIIMTKSDGENTTAEFILCDREENGLNGKRKYNRKKTPVGER